MRDPALEKALADGLREQVPVEKARRYINDESEAPEGVEVHQGEQGGLYYETSDVEGGEVPGGGFGGGESGYEDVGGEESVDIPDKDEFPSERELIEDVPEDFPDAPDVFATLAPTIGAWANENMEQGDDPESAVLNAANEAYVEYGGYTGETLEDAVYSTADWFLGDEGAEEGGEEGAAESGAEDLSPTNPGVIGEQLEEMGEFDEATVSNITMGYSVNREEEDAGTALSRALREEGGVHPEVADEMAREILGEAADTPSERDA